MVSVYSLQVKCNECGEVTEPDPPKNRLKWILGMAIIFAGIGFMIGSVAGVATAGVGFVAWVFTMPIGLYVGYKIGSIGAELADGPSCPECDAKHRTTGLLPF
ncbi:hypothetical protein [Natronorubrum daqingense]|uniref:Uncharacterized protein n=1 Tax=Natronorubrum daqingense TaxID=588898 RepID=A0A1N7FZF1_9EURY|nr:hypothetical protein [Natronorubrum daqingense]SIS05655.1 hypothetical protein SAMN05421809_3601 [Natronorubrum daqingense]